MRPVVLVLLAGLIASCSAETTPKAVRVTTSPVPSPSTPTPTRAADPFAAARRYEVSNPEELAHRLVAAERAIRSNGSLDELEEHGRAQQAAYRQLVSEPAWMDPALRDVPEDLRRVVQANVEAGAELRALTGPRPKLPPWRIVAPPPADELRPYYEDAQARFGVGWNYLAAIHLVETRMGRIRGTSTAGARGPMQFLPSTWARWGSGNIDDAHDSILAAARYLRGHGAPADMARALYAYNRSQRYVRAITLYAEQMRAEPRAYLGYYHWQVYYRTTRGDALLEVGWTGV